jgi:hypothetical protein
VRDHDRTEGVKVGSNPYSHDIALASAVVARDDEEIGPVKGGVAVIARAVPVQETARGIKDGAGLGYAGAEKTKLAGSIAVAVVHPKNIKLVVDVADCGIFLKITRRADRKIGADEQ